MAWWSPLSWGKKKNKNSLESQLLQYQGNIAADREAYNTPTEYESTVGKQARDFSERISNGDYRQPSQGFFFNMKPLADRQRERDQLANQQPSGMDALGRVNPLALRLNRQNANDQFEQDYAGDYQSAIEQGSQNAQNALLTSSQLQQGRLGARAGIDQNFWNALSARDINKPGFFRTLTQSFASRLGGAAGQFVGGGGGLGGG